MKKLTPAIIVLLALSANAEKSYLDSNHKPITKLDALLTLARDPRAVVYQIDQLELSEKATLRIKKAVKESK